MSGAKQKAIPEVGTALQLIVGGRVRHVGRHQHTDRNITLWTLI